jgi:hypothetical protein
MDTWTELDGRWWRCSFSQGSTTCGRYVLKLRIAEDIDECLAILPGGSLQDAVLSPRSELHTSLPDVDSSLYLI